MVSWKSGKRVIRLTSGPVLTDTGIVNVPEDTQNFRTVVTTQNTVGGPDATEALQAGIDYDIRPVINLKSTAELVSRFDSLFEQTHLPSLAIYNGTNMLVERSDVDASNEDRVILSLNRDGYDSIRGYTTDTSVYPYKKATQKLREVDYENRNILIHYEAYVEERSIINDRKTWQEAVDEGRLLSEESCVWRDLLPKGVTPDLSTITLREKDKLVRADTYENYKGSGRTLLVVEAKLTPVPATYRSGDMTYYMDVPRIIFDANYDFESWKDYGNEIHNVIAFESGNESLGTIDGYKGEADNPKGTNNVSTPKAFLNDEEKGYMDNLDKDRDDPTFVYAGTTTKIDILAAARTSLYKDVQVNNDGIWSEGTYYEDIYGPPVEATEGGQMRTVYEGGQYTYRLRVMSDPDTVSEGMIIYDALEDFQAKGNDNDAIDRDAVEAKALWKGRLREVDVSQLKEMGCLPVVYYSTKAKNYNTPEDASVALTDGNSEVPNNQVVNLSNSEIWTKAEDFTGNLSDVTAIAIDCRYADKNKAKPRNYNEVTNQDGSKTCYFRLQPMESAVVLVRMKAPSGDKARELIAKEGTWGKSAMAYNNAYLLAASFDVNDPSGAYYEDGDALGDFIRKDYTKVGMKEYSLYADKKWSDDDDRDGIRPDKITFRLYENGKATDWTETMNLAEGETSVKFEHVPYTDDDGEKIHYTIVEEEVEGYNGTYTMEDNQFHYTNTHEPEKINIPGEKTWEGDEEDNRPESIDVELYANGEKVKTLTVKPDAEGNWKYEFLNVFKYEKGKEIKYTVKEVKTPRTGDKLDSYTPDYDENNNILNTYHPYGALKVSKTVKDTTKASRDKEFIFTFVFNELRKGEDGNNEEVPVFDDFDYEILDADGNPVTDEDGSAVTGKIQTNGTVSIKGGQTIHVKELPEGLLYKVTEAEVPGFKLTEKTGDSGTIKPNAAAEANFINTYAASGQINLEAEKVLENRKLVKNQFVFELFEVTKDEEGNEVLKQKPSATNGAPDEESSDGGAVESTAPVTFGAIRFTHEDDGKTFTYRMNEVNRGKPGYEYSTLIYEVDVSVVDNGDGTLTITPVYKNQKGETVDKASFRNKYKASGKTTLLAWKELPGRNLKDGEFEFELLDKTGQPIMNQATTSSEEGDDETTEGDAEATEDNNEATEETAVTATNKKDGTVTFDPKDVEALNYTEADIGKTYYYAIREIAGDDDTVTYDEHVYGYAITISDNGDGTLFAEQAPATPVFDKEDPTKIVDWKTEGAVLPVFKNTLEDGGLAIQKTVTDSPDADPAQAFKFKVRLTGDNIPEGEKAYTIAEADEVNSGSSSSGADQNADGGKSSRALAKASAASEEGASLPKTGGTLPEGADVSQPNTGSSSSKNLKAAADDATVVVSQSGSNNWWGISWKILSDGQMILGNGSTETFSAGSGHMESYAPWEGNPYGYARNYFTRNVTSIRIDGTVKATGSFYAMFDLQYFPNCETIDLTGMDFSGVSNMAYMLMGGSKLYKVVFGETGTAANADISNMFANDFYVTEIDMSGFDTSKVSNMSSLFTYTTRLEKIHLSPSFQFKNGTTLNTPPNNSKYSGKWIRDDAAYGPYTPAELASNYNASMAGTWVWDEKGTEYTIKFTADAPVAGSMDSVNVREVATATLPANKFLKHGAEFDHWVVVEKNGTAVEDGTEYKDKATIPGNTYKKGDVITLKAVFKPVETTVNIENGEFEITLYAGEKAIFDQLPAGTTYQVYEETPAGWVLVDQSNVSGTIEPTVTSVASFVNKYEPGVATAQLYGTKSLDRKAAKAGAFKFTLKENGETLQTVSTLDGGFIQFAPIIYREAGNHTYTIEETAMTDDTIEYDTHAETVRVEVTADGEDLSTKVIYDDDGVKFANTTKPGNLKLTKKANGATDANDDVEFTFRIKFNNADGMPLGKEDKIYWFTEPNTENSTAKKLLFKAFGVGKDDNESEIQGNISKQDAVIAQNEAQASAAGSSAAKAPARVSLKAAAADDIASGTFRGADWRITSDGTLIIGNGGTQTLSGNGNKDNPAGWPWYNYRSRIKAVKFDGTVNMTGSAAGMFKNETNLVTFDSTGFNPSTANNFCHMFYGCRNLTSVDARGWVTSRVAYIDGMFMNCYALKKVVTSEWDVSSVVTIYQLFENCNNLEEVDTSSWKTYKANAFHWMNDIFSDCHKLKDVDTSGWVIQDTIEGWQWFNNDEKIRRLDLTGITRPTNAQYQTNCFVNMKNLSIFKVGSKTFDNNVARFQPGTWKNLATGVTYDGDWLNRNWKSTMAGTYARLTATFYKNGEMIIDWGYDESRNSEVDEVFYISNNTGDTPPWNSYSGKSRVTKVTINTDISPVSTAAWFSGMSSLKDVNGLDHLKMDNLTNMQNMFQGCTSLEQIYLPENFSFKGKNITSTSLQALLPTPPSSDGFTGQWIRDDEAFGPWTPAQLRDQFSPAAAGVWVWAVDTNTAMITFNGNGGYPLSTRHKTNDTSETVTMPDDQTMTRSHYRLTGWNTKADGSGTSYEPGEEVSGLLELGKNKVLYAQWETTDLRSYKVEHYQQKADGSGYNLVDSERPPMVAAGTEVTPDVKTYAGFLSPDPQTATVLDDDSLVIKYYYDKLTYKVQFDGNGATSGSMSEQTIQGGTMTPLSANQYKRDEYLFVGWNTESDGTGKYFIDQQKVRDLTKVNGDTVTLYAQWLSKDDQALEPTNGEIIVKCKAGESIVIPELPAGTTYTIEEINVPDGWSQSGEIDGNNEAIAANVTKYATATNVYKATGEAQINAHKTLEGADIEEGQFTFELYDDEALTELRDTATNGAVDTDANNTGGQGGSNPYYQTSLVAFTPIEYTQEDIGKTFTYYIRETGSVNGIKLDENVYEATVAVEDAGSGMLDTTVTYKNTARPEAEGTAQEPIFVNKVKPAELDISKTITGATEGLEDTEFVFTVDLFDAAGNTLEGKYETKKGDAISNIGSGETVKLKGGETIRILGLPHGTTYKVTEQERDNWNQTEATGTEGTLQPDTVSTASFTNNYTPPDKYTAKGSVQLTAEKDVEGGTILESDNFTFELTDPEGNVQTKSCDKVSTETDPVTHSTVTFDPIRYTLDDLAYTDDDQEAIDQYVSQHLKQYQDQYDAAKAAYETEHAGDDPPAAKFMDYSAYIKQETGLTVNQLNDKLTEDAESQFKKENTFIYYVREVAGDDENVKYDPTRYCYEVHAVDKGDGTIETTVTKKQLGFDEDTQEPKDTEVDDIVFVNSKLTNIKVYKKWVDNDNIDGVRPDKDAFVSKLHLLKNGTEIEVDPKQIKVTEDEDGNLTVAYIDLPAYDEDGEITYTVKEDNIDYYTSKDGKDEVADGETLMNVHTPGTTDLVIAKSLDGYYDGGAQSNVTLAFKVEAKDKNGKVIFTGYAGLTFKKGDELSKQAVVKNVPEKATEILVSEEYSGAYKKADAVKAVFNENSGIWEVEMTNTHKDEPHEGSGIVNEYDDGQYHKPGETPMQPK